MSNIKAIPRRIITRTKDGKSYIAKDEIVTNVSEHFPGLIISDIWQTSKMPATFEQEKPIENSAIPSVIKNGTYFSFFLAKYF